MASPFENRRVAYHKIVRFNNSYGIRHFCDEQALNSLHFLTALRQGFCVQLLLGRAAKRLHPTPAVQVVNEGTRPRSNTSETRLRRAARKILPFEEDEAPYRRDHSPAGGRILRGVRSRGPTAVSASSISRFLGLGACAVAASGSIVPSITLIEPPACASIDVFRYSIMASSSWSDRRLITLLCSTLCSRGHSSARIFKYAAGCVRRTRSIAFGPPCRKSRSKAAINSPFNC